MLDQQDTTSITILAQRSWPGIVSAISPKSNPQAHYYGSTKVTLFGIFSKTVATQT